MTDILFQAKTVQTSNLKSLFELLKNIIIDLNLVITKEKIKIVELNTNHISLVYVGMLADNFEEYSYNEDTPLILGINTENLYKIIKTVKHDETITLFVKRNAPKTLCIRKENESRNYKQTFSLGLDNIEYYKYDIPPIDFKTSLTMSSSEFQKICKDFCSLGAKKMEIKNIKDGVFFEAEGEFTKINAVIGSSENTTLTNDNEIVQGVFDIKYLLLFSKASNLSNTVQLYLKNDYPLVMIYKIGTLGEIKFIVSLIQN